MSKEIQNLETFKEVQAEKFYQKKVDVANGVMELGKILCETKDKLPHGEWLQWLEDSRVGFKERNAQRYMRIYNELGKNEMRHDMSYLNELNLNKLYELASAPEEKREDIINNSKDSKELEENIKKLQEEKTKRKELEKQIKEEQEKHKKELDKMQKELDNKEPTIIEKVVEKTIEKIPEDYEENKIKIEELQGELEDVDYRIELKNKEVKQTKEEYERKMEEMQNTINELKENEKFYSEKFREENAPLQELMEQFAKHQFGYGAGGEVKAASEIGKFLGYLDFAVEQITPIMYSDVIQFGLTNNNVKNGVNNLISKLEKLSSDLRKAVSDANNGNIIIDVED